MTRGMAHEQKSLEKQIEKQMGCMAGFLHIFDRHHMLAGKRIYFAKPLPASSASQETDSSPEKTGSTPAESTTPAPSTPESATQPPTPEATLRPETPVPLSVFEFKEGTRSPWKFAKEAPRLSLDSRAVADAKGTLHPIEIRTNTTPPPPADVDKQRKSTSVIARLMGLDEPSPGSDPKPEKKSELRRSASESRVHRDLNLNHQYRFFDTNGFQLKQLNSRDNGGGDVYDRLTSIGRGSDPKAKGFPVRNAKTEPARANLRSRGTVHKKSFYDSADFFPDAKQSVSIYGEIERRLKMRGIDEPSKDLDTLKQILEALQLKGLLHSKSYAPPTNRRNFVIDGSISRNDSPIVVMKPGRLTGSFQRTVRFGSDSPPPSSFGSSPRARRNNETIPLVSPRRERPEVNHRNVRAASQARTRTSSSPTRAESGVRSPSMNWKVNDAVNRRISPVHSVKANSRMSAPEQNTTSRSPRMRRGGFLKEEKVTSMGVAEDEASTVSESSFSTSSFTDTVERLKMDEYREGRNLLERCDKLLNSIAEITAAAAAGAGQTELQPSPVSVLDSSFYKDESSCSPSPVMKRCIDYKEQAVHSEDDMWSGALCYSETKSDESTEDRDFVYVSEILRACNYLPEDSDIFLLLEKQHYLKGNDASKVSSLRRRLIFDTVHEILHRNRRLPPWKEATWAENTSLLHRIWSEFRRIRNREEEEEVSEELFEVICGMLKKDVAEDGANEWGECPVEVGDVVLDMERLVFKDLIGDTIRELASCEGLQFNRPVHAFRRKLLF